MDVPSFVMKCSSVEGACVWECVELALSDYTMVSKLEPSNSRQALHKYKQQ